MRPRRSHHHAAPKRRNAVRERRESVRERRESGRERREPLRARRRRLVVEPLETRRVLASLFVDSALDVVDGGDGVTSLREAITMANSVAGADTVIFDPAAFSDATTIELTLGELVVTDSLTIEGPDSNLTLHAAADSRVLLVDALASDVTLERIAITGGSVSVDDEGGAGIRFLSDGILLLRGVTLFGNQTTGRGGVGGAIEARGAVRLEESLVFGNSTDGDDARGGGLFVGEGDLTLVHSEVSGNLTRGQRAGGGGIYADAVFAMSGSFVTNNRTLGAEADGGGIVVNGAATIDSSDVSANNTAGVDADGGGIRSNSTLNVHLTRFADNETAGQYSSGGAVASAEGDITLTSSSVTGNRTAGRFAYGGGVLSVRGDVIIRDSTLSGNSASGPDADGGGLASFFGNVTIQGTTITSNLTGGDGGGISVFDNEDKTLTLLNSIVAGNAASGVAPDFLASQAADSMTVRSSLVGDNSGSGLLESQSADAMGNLIGAPSPGGGLIDAMLEPLHFNGQTLVHPLMSTSPALDAGDNTLVTSAFDGRGAPFARIANGVVDMGAFESQTPSDAAFIVTTQRDELDHGNAETSLREAIVVANGVPGKDSITFAGDEFDQSASIDLVFGELHVADTVAITGTGATRLAINAQGNSRVLNVASSAGDVAIAGLTITGGSTTLGRFAGANLDGVGGGVRFVSAGRLSITESLISGNRTAGAGASGGGVYSRSGVIEFDRSTVSHNQTTGRSAVGGGVAANTHVFVQGSRILDNQTSGEAAVGGGLASFDGRVTVLRSEIAGNRTTGQDSPGGGIFSAADADLLMTESVLAANQTSGSDSPGAGLFATDAQLRRSTVSANETSGSGGDGAGLHAGQLELLNSTVSGNITRHALSSGGGIVVGDGEFTFSTITRNVSASHAGGVEVGAALQITQSIVADNIDDGTAPDLKLQPAATVSAWATLVGDNTGSDLVEAVTPDAFGNRIGASAGGGVLDPLLGPLKNNGGSVPTHAPQFASPAIDGGDIGLTIVATSDGRGAPFQRLFGGLPDLGAVEVQSVPVHRFIVTTVSDELDESNEVVSLREAIQAANGSPGTDVISFDPVVFADPTSIVLSLGELEVSESLTIHGPGSSVLTIDANHLSRVIHFSESLGDLVFIGATLTGGRTPAGESGGGVRFASSGSLTLKDVEVTSNVAFASGGGLFSAGITTIEASVISGNSAAAMGGGIATQGLTLSDSVVSTNVTTGELAHGGGVSAMVATIVDSKIENNQVIGQDARGGGIAAVESDIRGSVLANNTAMSGVGGGISSTRFVRLSESAVSGNTSGVDGGGIHASTDQTQAVEVVSSSVSLNHAVRDGARGGAIFVQGSTAIRDSTVSGNSAIGNSTDGGGVFVESGALEIMRSTIVSNTATRVGGAVLVPFASEFPLTINSSILADNVDSGIAPNFRAIQNPSLLNVGFSLIDDNSGTTLGEAQTPNAFGNLIGRPAPFGGGIIDPMLAPLTQIGDGQVHPLLVGSPAIGAGDNGGVLPLHDQRGAPFARVFGAGIDIGAFENQPPVEPVIDWSSPSPVLVGTRLGDQQLNARTNTAGTFGYSPVAGTRLDVGDGQELRVDFTPDDATYFVPTSMTVTIDVRPPLDFGDAPASYLTSLADDGPRHADSSLSLGSEIDFEVDGFPSRRADGDGGDEDGIVWITDLVTQSDRSTTASFLAVTSARAKLDAWIDFNGNGVFDHPQEHLRGGTSIDLSRGENLVEFDVPAGSIAGETFARFRLSSEGGLLPVGLANDGEVEDHQVAILDGAQSPLVQIQLPRGTVTLSTVFGELFVRRGGDTLFRASSSQVSRFDIVGTDFSDVLVIDTAGGDPLPPLGMNYDGGGLVNTVRLVGPAMTLDTSSDGAVQLRNIDVIDVSVSAATTVIVDVESVTRMDPTGSGVILTGGSGDAVDFVDAASWRMNEPVSVAGFTFSTVATVGTFVQVDFALPWQNLAQNSDVNNDGRVSASDALQMINELGRRTFSDPDTDVLTDPADLSAWPNIYLDPNGDGRASALDALQIINELGRTVVVLSGESLAVDSVSMTLASVDSQVDVGAGDREMEIDREPVRATSRLAVAGPSVERFVNGEQSSRLSNPATDVVDRVARVDQLLSDTGFEYLESVLD